MANPPVGSDWTCKKCGYGAENPPPDWAGPRPKISWSSDKPNKIFKQCVVCGYSEYIPTWT